MANYRNGPGSKVAGGNQYNKGFMLSFMQGGGQNAALKYLTENAIPVSVFLITGVKFDGVITAFDQYTICIRDIKEHQQLIYKDKISTLSLRKTPFSSQRPVPGREGPREAASKE
ncbi:MAG: RNA chaperone Hfq [Succinivibrio sp.]